MRARARSRRARPAALRPPHPPPPTAAHRDPPPRAGAKPELCDQEGKTALDYAESAEFDDIVEVLAGVAPARPAASPMHAGYAPSPRGRGGGDGLTPRMTPRVPHAGNTRMTPRTPRAASASASQTSSGRYLGAGRKVAEIDMAKVRTLDAERMLYLTKKLVHLSLLLEKDTGFSDALYPSFHC